MLSFGPAVPTQGSWDPRCTPPPIRPFLFPPGHCLPHHDTEPKNPVLRTLPSYLRDPGLASPASNSYWSHVPSTVSIYQGIIHVWSLRLALHLLRLCHQCHPHPVSFFLCTSDLNNTAKEVPIANPLYENQLHRTSERAREIEGKQAFAQLPLVCFACNPQIPSNPISNYFVKWIETTSFSPTSW